LGSGIIKTTLLFHCKTKYDTGQIKQPVIEKLSVKVYRKLAFLLQKFPTGNLQNRRNFERAIPEMVKEIILWREYRGRQALPVRVQGAQLPCAGQGRQPLPSRVDACVGSYWVLPDAEIGRTGSKAALLPSSALGENERNCPVPCVQGTGSFRRIENWTKGEKTIE